MRYSLIANGEYDAFFFLGKCNVSFINISNRLIEFERYGKSV